jgi:sRNA-binding regulator protein Hfq
MNTPVLRPHAEQEQPTAAALPTTRPARKLHAPEPFRFTSHAVEEESAYRQAELFYLQKQIQSQTQMVFVLSDGEKIEGVIEWYDRHALKVRGRDRMLIYKSSIKYMFKFGENSQQ